MSTVSGLDIANNIEREWRDRLEAAVKAAVKAEREACAKECGRQMGMIPMQPWTVNPYEQCAAAIRARSSNAP